MTEIKTTKIPQRQECVNKEHPYIGGAKDVIDDELGKPQSEVNQETNESLSTHAQQIEDLQAMEQIVIDGGEAQIAQGSDFDNPDSAKRAKIPTVGAVLDGISEGVFDLTAKTGDSYASLQDALTAANTAIPANKKKGGMQLSFVHSVDNNYVQFRCMAQSFTTDVTQWQGVDSEPVGQSKSLLESGGAFRTMFPVMYFVGKGDTHVPASPTNAILLANHHYRFHLMGFDMTGVTVGAYYGIIAIKGKDDEDNTVTIADIKRGEGAFTYPATIDYKPTQNIRDLIFNGRNSNGVRANVIVEDLENKDLPLQLTLDGDGTNYVNGFDNVTLYPGTYRCNIRQWDVSGLTYAGSTIAVVGKNSNGEQVNSVLVDNRNYTGIPEYIDFTVEEILYNVSVRGRAKSGTKGIVTISEVKENTFPVLTMLGLNSYNNNSLKSNGILLKGHKYRFHISGIDLTGVSLTSAQGVIAVCGYTEDDTRVIIFNILRGSDALFVSPEYVEYIPDQNIYGLYISGRNSLNKETKVVVEDISIVDFPVSLSLVGNNGEFVETNYGITLYKGSYRCNIVDWNIQGISFAGQYIGLRGKNAAGDYVNLFVIDNRTVSTTPEYVDFSVTETLYNVQLKGRAKVNTTGIVTLIYNQIPDAVNAATPVADEHIVNSSLIRNLILEQGSFSLSGTDWATNGTNNPNRLRSKVMKADDVTIEIPKGFRVAACYGIPGQEPTRLPGFFTDTLIINKTMKYIRFYVMRNNGAAITPNDISIKVTGWPNVVVCDTLDFPMLGSGSKMMSLPHSIYTHCPCVVETKNYIFISYASNENTTAEVVGSENDALLCVIDKGTGEQWYEYALNHFTYPVTVENDTFTANHNWNMTVISDDEVLFSFSVTNDDKLFVVNRTYNAATKTMSSFEKSQLSYNDGSPVIVEFSNDNYNKMANALYDQNLPEDIGKVAHGWNMWGTCKYTHEVEGVSRTDFLALFSFATHRSSGDTPALTPYIMMTSEDAKTWTPLFLLCDDLAPGETQPIWYNDKIYITNRIGGSFVDLPENGQWYAVCDMSGNFLMSWTKLNVQRARPCEVLIDGKVYIIYHDGNNSGKYWGRRKFNLCKVNADYSITEIQSWSSPHGMNYPSACDHNGAILLVYAEDRRGLNATNGQNAITDVAAAQIFLP